ncbi:YoaK family protein [Microvirga soli]|uniref:YoaK family protein n=1 Tax=Microvirga soli TaxID=1854496 RepID=UPI00191D8F3D
MNRQHRLRRKRGLVGHYARSARRIIAPGRSARADTRLGMVLAFVAGAANAGGFLVMGQYTSHMSGIFSSLADNLVLGAFGLVIAGTVALMSFVAGAACSAILINWGRRGNRRDLYARPLLLEAALLLGFGLLGGLAHGASGFTPLAVLMLCFIMGLQNATVTKISGARIRTTHVTGIITDVGIELGKLVYWNRDQTCPETSRVRVDRPKLRLLSLLLGFFFASGLFGAFGFQSWGFATCLPLGLLLLLLAVPSLADDLLKRRRALSKP